MIRLKIHRVFTASIIILCAACIAPACAPSQRTTQQQRQSLMIQDKADYSRNKKFKKSKSYKRQKRRYKRYMGQRVRR